MTNEIIRLKRQRIRRQRRTILSRYKLDKWEDVRCIKCDELGNKDNVIQVHHLIFQKDKPNKHSDSDNIVQICNSCHIEFHKYCDDIDTKQSFINWLGRPLHYHMLKYVPRETKWYEVFTDFNCHKIKGNKGIFYLVRSTGC